MGAPKNFTSDDEKYEAILRLRTYLQEVRMLLQMIKLRDICWLNVIVMKDELIKQHLKMASRNDAINGMPAEQRNETSSRPRPPNAPDQ